MRRQFSFNNRKDFSSKENKKTGASSNYEDEFADMLNQGKVTEKQQSEFEQRRQEKADSVLKDQQKQEKLLDQDHKQKE